MNSNPTRSWFSQQSFRQPGFIFIVFTVCFVFWLIDLWRPYNAQKNEHNFVWDMFGYYCYLPAFLLKHGDFSACNNAVTFLAPGPLGLLFPKYTYGVALLQLPFFLIGCLISNLQGGAYDGFSPLFQSCIEYGTVLYTLAGAYFLRKFLKVYFSEMTVAITLMVCVFGSMLFMYTFIQAGMSHAYLFFLFSVFIFATQRYYLSGKKKYLIAVAITGALVVLIRPIEIYIFLFFILFGIHNLKELKERLLVLMRKREILLIPLAILIFWMPQFLFWKNYSGQFFYFSYKGEKFFWNDPQIINILFSYRKGWLLYTPLVLVCFIGFFFLKRPLPYSGWTFLLVTSLTVYVFSCWWDWTYGGCFGAREFCQQIAYLSLPLAAVIEKCRMADMKKVVPRLAALVLFTFLFSAVFLNIGQTYQYQKLRKLHGEATSKKLYWGIFRLFQFSDHFNQQIYWESLEYYDAERWKQGKDRNDKVPAKPK